MNPEDKKMLIDGGIDFEAGVDRFGGNEAMFEKFICRFLKDDHLDQLRHAMQNGETEEAHRIAHTLKGIVGNLSFGAYYQAISAVTDALKEGDLSLAEAQMGEVDTANANVKQALDVLCSS